MAAEWYYTTNKQQMGPVTWDELRELAESGILKSTDMVWSEGMPEWVKAINQKGLFSDDDGIEADTTPKKKGEAKPPPGRRKRRKDEDDEDDDEDERESKRKNREREQEKAKMGVALKVGLIVGGILLGLLLCGGCGIGIFLIAFSGGGGVGPPGAKVRDNYTIFNLNQGQQNFKEYRFTQGSTVVINVENRDLAFANTDVDLFVIRTSNNFLVASDTDIPARNRHCRVEFRVPATDTYRVRVVNLGPGQARRCEVRVEER